MVTILLTLLYPSHPSCAQPKHVKWGHFLSSFPFHGLALLWAAEVGNFLFAFHLVAHGTTQNIAQFDIDQGLLGNEATHLALIQYFAWALDSHFLFIKCAKDAMHHESCMSHDALCVRNFGKYWLAKNNSKYSCNWIKYTYVFVSDQK